MVWHQKVKTHFVNAKVISDGKPIYVSEISGRAMEVKNFLKCIKIRKLSILLTAGQILFYIFNQKERQL